MKKMFTSLFKIQFPLSTRKKIKGKNYLGLSDLGKVLNVCAQENVKGKSPKVLTCMPQLKASEMANIRLSRGNSVLRSASSNP